MTWLFAMKFITVAGIIACGLMTLGAWYLKKRETVVETDENELED
ncbi:hypothetical protein [Polycladospora coralii]|nr:hypothetical protein [Polycladospora coralii]